MGEKFRLGPAGALGLIFGHQQFVLHSAALGDFVGQGAGALRHPLLEFVVGTAQVFGAVHIEAASTYVSGGIPRGEASLEPLACGDFSTFNSGGHFGKITGARAHAWTVHEINNCSNE